MKSIIDNEKQGLVCGSVIPEGRWLCPSCEEKYRATKEWIDMVRMKYKEAEDKEKGNERV